MEAQRNKTLRPKIRANSNHELEKAKRVHMAPRTFRPRLNDSSRELADSDEKKQSQESELLKLRFKRFDDLRLGLSLSSPSDATLLPVIRANHIGKRPHGPTPVLDFNCACINGTKAICAALRTAAVYCNCAAMKPAPCAKLSKIDTTGLFAVRSAGATASTILSRPRRLETPSIVQIQQPLRSQGGS